MWQRAGMQSEIEIRPVTVEDRRAAYDAFRAALLVGPISDEHFEEGAASWDDSDSLVACDAGRCVAHVGAFRFDTTVPGGARLDTAGVTRVGVLPTHTRRGVLTTMMRRLLTEARDRGQVLSSLRASETPIYGRFGFGLGGDIVLAEIDPARARPLRAPGAPGRMRLLAPDEVLDTVPPIYDRVARQRVGTVSRPAWMWQRYLKETTEPSTDVFGKGAFVAVHEDPNGSDDGYVHYEVQWADEFAADPTGHGKLIELWGASTEVERSLWQYLLDLDLVTRWRAEERPVDDPIRRTFHDHRAYRTRLQLDEQWVRVLDVDAALTARHYGPAAGAVTIEVSDPLFPANCGRWRLSADGARATSDAPALSVDIATLSAAYLGGTSWRDLVDAGSVPGPVDGPTIDVLDALFATRPAPFSGTFF